MSCDCYCSVALPNGAVGWFAVCDCGFPDHVLNCILANSDGQEEMPHDADFIRFLLFAMTKQSYAKEIHVYAEFISFDPSVYTMDHSKFITLDKKEESIRA